ncbi:calcium-binding protein [Pseudomonas sp. PDM15]|uniref:calcium-binding protein n=1 Tax=Pseudomonas sp. PDM15 TaxID=2769303 RepID=UPI00177FB376|nr:calcium-binding protein [Pseudomonas sp. PDM15]MBD9426959.1 calcium-binding protein [Pseudomonas sp. PDM15]
MKNVDNLKGSIDAYNTAQTAENALDIAQAVAQTLGVAAVAGLTEVGVSKLLQKSGLDRVFDSLKKNKEFNDYLKEQLHLQDISSISIAMLVDFGIDYYNKNVSLGGAIYDLIHDDVNVELGLASQTMSPMVVDLDGDGIETFGAEGQVLFDHDGDGNKHGSGWVNPDDGLLVLDRNGNGSIDNGHELFGENTLLADGSKAKDGFEAMQAVDSNADGKLDASDAVWADLRVWRDLNGDGISQSGELLTLQEVGIESIGTGSDGKTKDLGNDNHIDGFGTFQWDANRGGGTGVSGDVYFEDNPFYREFADSIEIPAGLVGVANMHGSGAVRDLREAAATSESLQDALAAYSAAGTRLEQHALLDQLIRAWANSADFRTFDERVSDLAEGKLYDIEFGYSWEIDKPPLVGAGSSSGGGTGGGSLELGEIQQDPSPTAEQLRRKELLEMVRVLEVFNGQYFFDFKPSNDDGKDGEIGISFIAGSQGRSGSAGGGSIEFGATYYLTEEDFSFGPNQERHIRAAYQALMDSVYNGLLLQTRLQPYVEAISFVLSGSDISLDFSGALDKLEQLQASNPVKAVVDILEFGSAIAGTAGWASNEIAIAGEWVRQLSGAQVEELKKQLGSSSSVIFDSSANGSLVGGARADFLFGEAGNDSLTGNDGTDFLDGGAGDDRLWGNNGNDLLLAGAGNDNLYGGEGNDVLDGGVGNDSLSGDAGSDVYRFSRGWGQDSVSNYDTSTGKVDAIEFAADIAPSDIHVSRSGDALILSLVGSTDKVTVNNYFDKDGASTYKLEEIRFADGTIWGIDKVKALVLISTAGNDNLRGYASADQINGGVGNDYLYGAAGDDQLNGGLGEDRVYGEDGNDQLQGAEGNDNLYGGNGDDVLDGGVGNDSLSGDAGSDVYRFNRGWGQDTVSNNDSSTGKVDVIEFASDIAPSDIQITRSSDNLILSLVGSTDKVTVTNYFDKDGTSTYKLEEIRFADGTTWSIDKVKELALLGTTGNDNLRGYATADQINSGAGNDYLYGAAGDDQLNGELGDDRVYGEDGNDLLLGAEGADNLYGGNGNDVLDGGVGNDSLSGDAGSDVYRFSRGWGQDTVSNNDSSTGKVDAIEFASDIAPSDIQITRSGDNLVLSLVGSTDKVTVNNYFDKDGTSTYKLEEIRFADSTTWSIDKVKELALLGTAGNDTLRGYASADQINAGAGNDYLYGAAGNDVLGGEVGNDYLYGEDGNDSLNGGEGTDTLYGGTGNDVLDGGVGNDTLNGDAGSDVYRFSRGWGQDTVSSNDSSTGKVDAIEFASDIAPSDIQITRSGDHLILSLVGSTDKVTVSNYFNSDGASAYKLEEVRFADGTTWSIDKVKELALLGTAGNDNLRGYASADQINAAAGNDYLYGAAGHDVLGGDAGNDYLYGEDGNDSLNGGEGTDNLYGGNGNDVLDGGVGNDSLNGDVGSDVYRFSRGWGQDSVNNYDTSTGKVDAIEFASDIAPSDIQITRSGDNLILSLVGSADKVTVSNYFNSDGASNYKLEEVRFADGTTWSIDKVKELALLGTAGNDNLRGYASADQINAGAGNDYLYGAAGNDVLGGEVGNDYLYGEDGNDSLNGGEGTDNLSGGNGNDVLDGGVGNDTLNGDAGSDVYRFSRGWGQDTVSNYDTSTGKVDAIEFAADIAPSDIQVTRSGDNLILSLAGSTDKVTVSNYFNNGGASTYKLEEVRFANGTVWAYADIKQKTVFGTNFDDTLADWDSQDELRGGAGNDTLDGGKGSNRLFGEAGDDVLRTDLNYSDANLLAGGTGNDTLYGSYKNDTYLFNLGDGVDTIVETSSVTGAVDVLRFGEGIKLEDLQFQRSGVDLVIAHANGVDKVVVKNVLSSTAVSADWSSSTLLEKVEFADGTTLTWSQLFANGWVQQGGSGNDTLLGHVGTDELRGGAGNDTLDGGKGSNRLFGEAGDDVLRTDLNYSDANLLAGGTGNDILNGSYKNDIYLFNLGDGVDTIVETSSVTGAVDVLRFGEGIKLEDLQFQRSGVDLVIAHANGVDKVVVKSVLSSTAVSADWSSSTRLEKVEFADGTTLTWSQLFANGWVQQGGSGNDTLLGHVGTDELRGGAGNDTLDGGKGSNRLFGEAGDDVLRTDLNYSDANLLAGGTGNDTLYGSYKNDTYLFNLGDGVDAIVETSSVTGAVDILQFGSDIDAEELWLSRSGNDLKLQVIGTDDSVSIKNWYSSSSYQVEQLQVADGRALTASQVQNLVNAMASFGVPAGGEGNLTADQRQQLDVVIAANWQ